jgi:hypothetical protein
MITVMVGSLVAWLIVNMLTRPTDSKVLDDFYKRVRPPGFWGPVYRRLGMKPLVSFPRVLFCWFIMLVGIYCPLVGLIKLCLGNVAVGLPMTVAGVAAIVIAVWQTRVMYSSEPTEHLSPEPSEELPVRYEQERGGERE